MSEVTIYGCSDDLIMCDGAIHDEYYPKHDGTGYLHFNEGSVVKVQFDKEGVWRVEVVKLGEGTVVVSHEVIGRDMVFEEEDYSDRLTLAGNIKSAACYGSPDGPDDSDLEDFWENFDFSEHDNAKLLAAMQALQ